MAIYSIVDNRDIDNKQQDLLSSVTSLSTFFKLSSDFQNGEALHPMVLSALNGKTIQELTSIYDSIKGLYLSDLTQLCADVSGIIDNKFDHVVLSDFVSLSTDIEYRLQRLKINETPELKTDVQQMIENSGGTAKVAYKYWGSLHVPRHPGTDDQYDLTDAEIFLNEQTRVFDGKSFAPTITKVVSHGVNVPLSCIQTSYSATSEQLSNVGTYQAIATGIQPYSKEAYKSFSVTPKSITTWSLAIRDTYPYTGNPIFPNVEGLNTYTYGQDYLSSCIDNINPGNNAQLSVIGINNYTDSQVIKFTITSAEKTDLSAAQITLQSDEYRYTGRQICPSIAKVELNDVELIEGTDYLVTYGQNIAVGSGSLTITACNSSYTGSRTISFVIKPGIISYSLTPSTTTAWTQATQVIARVNSPASLVTPKYSTSITGPWSTTTITVGGHADDYQKLVKHTVYVKLEAPNYETVNTSCDVTLTAASLANATVVLDPANGYTIQSPAATVNTGAGNYRAEPTVSVDGFKLTKDKHYSTTYTNIDNKTLTDGQSINATLTITSKIDGLVGSKPVNYPIRFQRIPLKLTFDNTFSSEVATITATAGTNTTINGNVATASVGSPINITVNPNSGFQLYSYTLNSQIIYPTTSAGVPYSLPAYSGSTNGTISVFEFKNTTPSSYVTVQNIAWLRGIRDEEDSSTTRKIQTSSRSAFTIYKKLYDELSHLCVVLRNPTTTAQTVTASIQSGSPSGSVSPTSATINAGGSVVFNITGGTEVKFN